MIIYRYTLVNWTYLLQVLSYSSCALLACLMKMLSLMFAINFSQTQKKNTFGKCIVVISQKYYSASFMDLVGKMLAYNPEKRPTIAEILEHEWCREDICSIEELNDEFTERTFVLHKKLEIERKKNEKKRKQNQIMLRQQEMQNRSGKENTGFLKIFNEENAKQRKLPILEWTLQDIRIMGDFSMSIAMLIQHIKEQQIMLQESGIENSQLGIFDEQTILRMTKVDLSADDQLIVQYTYNYQLNEEVYEGKVEMSLGLGCCEKELVVRPALIRGDQMYYRKIVDDLKVFQ